MNNSDKLLEITNKLSEIIKSQEKLLDELVKSNNKLSAHQFVTALKNVLRDDPDEHIGSMGSSKVSDK